MMSTISFQHLVKGIATLVLSCIISTVAFSQVSVPQPSPLGKINQRVGLVDIQVEYSRPSAKGRTVFGDLVPFGNMWRTGANAATKVSFSDDVYVNEQKIAKGTYALYTIPNQAEWTIILHKNTNYSGTGGKDYNPSEEAVRFTTKPTEMSPFVETFTIEIGNLTNASCVMALSWANVRVPFQITMDTDAKVVADINDKLSGPSANTYYQAARYYYEEKKDMQKALEWVNLSLEKGGEKYWIIRLRALIHAELGDYKQAIRAAERSMELAKADGNDDFYRMNKASIEEWKNKK